jgi:hypothetical protein
MPQLEIGSGRTLVRVNWCFRGADLCVHIGGGDDHVGAVALAGRAENGATCAESLCVAPHKESGIALAAARRLQAAVGANVCVTAGIHVDEITPAEISAVTRNAELAIENLLAELGTSGGRASRA